MRGKQNKSSTIGFLTPGLGLLFAFIVLPILFTAWLSLNHWSMFTSFTQMDFVGMENYKSIFEQETFKKALINTLVFSGLSMIIMLPLSLFIGIFLYSVLSKVSNLVRTLLFIPYIIPPVAGAIIWSYLYAPTNGPFNQILAWLHIPTQEWLTSPHLALISIVIFNVWQTIGYYTVIILAGMTEIPKDYYEASSIDGAGKFKQTFFITIPLLKRSMLFVIVIMAINTLQMFDPVYILTQGGPVDSSTVISHHLYKTAFEFGEAGKASAMAMVLLVIIFVFTILQLRIFKSDD